MSPFCRLLIIVLISLAAISCRDERFRQLDEAIRNENVYSERFEHRMDSLRNAFETAPNDTVRWESLYDAAVSYIYYDIDSAIICARALMSYLEDDAERTVTAKSVYAEALLKQGKFDFAESVLNSIDFTPSLPWRAYDAYCTAMYQLCLNRINNNGKRQEYLPVLIRLKESLRERDSTALIYQNVWTQLAFLNGDYNGCKDCLLSIPFDTLSLSYRSGFNYCLARCYENLGDTDKMIERLAASAIADIQMNSRIYASLNTLSYVLYKNNDFERANRYAKKALRDASLCKYPGRLSKSAATASLIYDKTGELQRKLNRSLVISLSVISALFAVSLILLFYNRRVSRRFEHSSRMLSKKTLELNKVSAIQNLMLGHYMELSAEYIGRVDQMKSKLRRTLKQDGIEAMTALLRGPAFADSEYPNFYAQFDKAFLSIFPKFIEQANALLKPEMQFSVKSGDNLPTELRILALICLGITDSGRIANVLRISRGTVYTYRSAMRIGAICPPEEFEDQIARLSI